MGGGLLFAAWALAQAPPPPSPAPPPPMMNYTVNSEGVRIGMCGTYESIACSCAYPAQLDYCSCGSPLGTDYEIRGCCNMGCGRCDISLLGCPSPPPPPPLPPPPMMNYTVNSEGIRVGTCHRWENDGLIYSSDICSCANPAQSDYCDCGSPLGTDYEIRGCCSMGCGGCDISLLDYCPSPPPAPPPPLRLRHWSVGATFTFMYTGDMDAAALARHIFGNLGLMDKVNEEVTWVTVVPSPSPPPPSPTPTVSSAAFCAVVSACQADAFDAYQDDGAAMTNVCADLAVTTGAGLLDVAEMGCTGPLTSVASEMSSATTCTALSSAYGSYCTALAACASCSSRRLSEGLEARRYEAQVHVGFADPAWRMGGISVPCEEACGQAMHVAWQNAGDFSDRIKKEEETLFLSWFDESVRTHIAKLRLVSWTDVTPNHGAFHESDEDEDSSGTPPTAAIGGGAAAAILLMLGLIFLYLRKKRAAGSQPAIALTAISLTTVGRRLSGRLVAKEKDLEGGATRKTTTYSVELTKTPLGLGLSLTDDVVTEIKSDSQVARDGRIKVGFRKADPNPDPDPNRSPNPNQVGDRVVAVNGEAPTTAKPSSTILQGIGAGTIVKLEFTSEPQAVSAMTEAGQSSSVSASQSKAQTVSVAVKARDAQKMSGAAELLESWKLEPSELVHGNKVGSGGQADVYLGRWQVSSRTSAHLPTAAASVLMPTPAPPPLPSIPLSDPR